MNLFSCCWRNGDKQSAVIVCMKTVTKGIFIAMKKQKKRKMKCCFVLYGGRSLANCRFWFLNVSARFA